MLCLTKVGMDFPSTLHIRLKILYAHEAFFFNLYAILLCSKYFIKNKLIKIVEYPCHMYKTKISSNKH
jgi:hypothetical protein